MLCFCLFSLRAITPSYGIFDGDNKQHSLNKLLFAPIAHKKAMLVYVILCACISRSLLKCSVCLLQTYYGGGVNYCITKEELLCHILLSVETLEGECSKSISSKPDHDQITKSMLFNIYMNSAFIHPLPLDSLAVKCMCMYSTDQDSKHRSTR
jgi:hypothetical protein